MKIVHCLFTMETGGAQVLTVELLNEMCRDHEVSLVIINNKFNKSLLDQLDKRVGVYFINRKEGNKNPLPILKLNWVIYQLKPDVIHCHEPKVAQVVKVKSARLLHTVHDVGIETTMYHLYDSIVAISDAVYNDVSSRYNGPVKKVYNGIPIHLFKRRTQYQLRNGEQVKFVQLSRLVHEKKGQDVLLRALHLLQLENKDLNFSLDFIGSGDSAEYLKELAAELGISNRVNFLGERNREWLFANLCNYHVLVQPSRYEGFGLTVLEGFAAGLPVLASDIDGPAEIISRAPGGFLFKIGDSESCAAQFSHILALYSKNEVGSLMEKTLQAIKQKYSIQSCSKDYLHEYALLKKADHTVVKNIGESRVHP